MMARRWHEEDLDEYENEEGDEEEEEEEEEEEPPKPSKEEMDYLKMRERLKERIRQKYRKENGRSAPLPSRAKAEFGSFFGPSQPVIARRVIEESHSMRETQHITSKTPTSHSTLQSKRIPPSINGQRIAPPSKPFNEVKSKVETLKDLRDYSFLLSDDADLPAPKKDPPPKTQSIPNSYRAPPKAKIPMVKPVRPGGNGYRESSKPGTSGQDHQKQASLFNAFEGSKTKHNAKIGSAQPFMHRTTSSSTPHGAIKKPPSVPGKMNSERRALPLKLDSSSKKQYPEQRSESQGLRKEMIAPRRPMSSAVPQHSKMQRPTTSMPQHAKPQKPIPSFKPQVNKPSKDLARGLQENKLKRKTVSRYSDEELEDDGDEAINMIRQMFRYNPKRYRDDEDDSDMEANFDDIMAEENRSSRIARKEDEEQLRLIEEEEERERMRKLAKKRKLSR